MELHAPEGPIRSVKDFALHLCVVTTGILIALGLEQVVESQHRSHLGREAVDGFHQEIAEDRKEVGEVLAAMPDLRLEVKTEIDRLSGAAIAAGSAASPIKYPDVHFNFISTASWDTALVTQGLAQLPYDRVKRYSDTYGVLRVFLDQERMMLDGWLNLRQFGDDASALTPDQRRDLIERLRRYDSITYTLEFLGKGALKACDEILKGPG